VNEQAVGPSGRQADLLGIDCGGSHTAVVVGNRAGHVLARAEGPGSAMRPGGAERSAAVILEVARRAATLAGVTLPAMAALVGAAGAGRVPEQEALATAVKHAGAAERVAVRGDVEIALAAAFGNGPGVLVNAGTGSIAYARVADGRLFRAGGHGWQLETKAAGLAPLARSGRRRGQGLGELSAARTTAGRARPVDVDDLIRWTHGHAGPGGGARAARPQCGTRR
jgi:glucosamine kinase